MHACIYAQTAMTDGEASHTYIHTYIHEQTATTDGDALAKLSAENEELLSKVNSCEVCVCAYIYVCVCVCMYVCMYIYIHKHTVHMYLHTHVCVGGCVTCV
jgi:hypothetical protein